MMNISNLLINHPILTGVAVACLLCPALANAEDSWKNVRNAATPGTPSRLLYVDKAEQKMRVVDTYTCTTGQKDGGKNARGDMRTPEGVYFVLGKIPDQLDMKLYGNMAYALNYPNPIDRLYGRTGYGIWLHSRGRDIKSKETNGCVVVNLDDMGKIKNKLTPGTPVVISDRVEETNTQSDATVEVAKYLQKRTDQWNRAWAAKSPEFYKFYDAQAYEKAQSVSFDTFKKGKEDSFAANDWIYIVHGPVNVLQGPDYWVTWFSQYYTSPTRTFEGTRRLYWIDSGGEYKVAGMEWIVEHASDITVAMRKVPKSIKTHTAVADAGLADLPKSPSKPKPATTIASATSDPVQTALSNARNDVKDSTKKPAVQQPSVANPSSNQKPIVTAATIPLPPNSSNTTTNQASPQIMTSVMNFVEAWRKSWLNADLSAYSECYADEAVQGAYIGKRAVRNHKKIVWKTKLPKKVAMSKIRIFPRSDGKVTVTMVQDFADATGYADKGIKTLVLEQDGADWLISSESWKKMR